MFNSVHGRVLLLVVFVENGRFQIDGKGKAMVVADSRANAVRYYFAIKEYLPTLRIKYDSTLLLHKANMFSHGELFGVTFTLPPLHHDYLIQMV